MALTTTKRSRSGMSAYGDYVAGLQRLASESSTVSTWQERTHAALNGQATMELRKVISLKIRRRSGAFFTGSKLAEKFISHCPPFPTGSLVHDPSVGGGDLLLAAASRLPLKKTLAGTLKKWGQQLTGTDLHPEFVRAAKTRLVLMARNRHGLKTTKTRGVTSPTKYFPGIRVADGLAQHKAFSRATHLFLNPPFGKVKAPVSCKWAGGKITAAAFFVMTALEQAKPGTELMAILPDVLRSGSFTEHWRRRVEKLADVQLIEPYGIFDESADVDVFLLRAVRRADVGATRKKIHWTKTPSRKAKKVSDHFEVHVGRVVPHRDPEKGQEHPYIHPRCIDPWKTVRKFDYKLRHKAEAFYSPFVAIRRTSRPGDLYRATATIIAGNHAVAVENHLIVCKPKDGKLATCRELMTKLKTTEVNKFLNCRICCRHLTVGAVREIPWLS
jgi:hypothetical protein